MHGIWCLLGMMVIFGMLGGSIFSLENGSSHKLHAPFSGKEYSTGFLGHMLIGIGGSFVSIAAATVILDLDITVFDQYWGASEPNTTKTEVSLLPIIIYVAGISIIGGYSGLQVISGLSSAMLKKLQRDMVEMQQSSDKEISALKKRLTATVEREKTHLRDSLLVKASVLNDNNRYTEAIELMRKYTTSHPEGLATARAWSHMGRAYKRMGQLHLAQEAALKALSLDDDDWVYAYNTACYICLNEGDKEAILKHLKEAKLRALKQNEMTVYQLQIDTDDDLKKFRNDLGIDSGSHIDIDNI